MMDDPDQWRGAGVGNVPNVSGLIHASGILCELRGLGSNPTESRHKVHSYRRPCARSRRRTLPLAVRGKLSIKMISRGHL